MNRFILYSVIGCALSVSAVFAEEPLPVRIKAVSGQNLSGTLSGRQGNVVLFTPSGSETAVQVLIEQISELRFPNDSKADEDLQRLFADGSYGAVFEKLNSTLPACLPYITIPSNFSEQFMMWLSSSFWVGEYERTLSLARLLMPVSSGADQTKISYFQGLALLETGDQAAVKKLLESSAGTALYPENSPERLYIEARLLQKQGRYVDAIRTGARLIARHGRNTDWMPRADLLCAELYFQLNEPESARAVLEDVNEFYVNPFIINRAAAIAANNHGEKK